MENINNKNTPDQMRVLMKRMRDGKYTNETVEPNKKLGMHEMLKITRNINEGIVRLTEDSENKKTAYDQNDEEEKLRNFFADMNVSIKLIDLGVFEDLVFWGGTVDGVIQFVYKVTPDEATSGVEFNYLEDFSPDNPENEEITGRLDSYFDTFYKFWRDNVISTDGDSEGETPVINLEPNTGEDLQQAAE